MTEPFSCIHGWPRRAMTIDQRRGRLPGGAASADGQPSSLWDQGGCTLPREPAFGSDCGRSTAVSFCPPRGFPESVELRWNRCESLGIFPELTALRGHASVLAGSNPSAASAWPWGTHLLHPGHFRRMLKPEIVDKQGAEGRNRTGDTRFLRPVLFRLSYLGASA